jgi:putative ABC transport system substrate-binding protein
MSALPRGGLGAAGDQLRRREFIAVVASAAATWPFPAQGQPASATPRVGYLSPGFASSATSKAFQAGLRELGYVEGTNIIVEYRYAEGRFDRLHELAAELAGLRVDIIVAAVTQASLAAQKATSTIPIVMAGVGDPVGVGLVTSLSRPDANITGTSGMTVEVVGKTLEIAKELVPKASRVAVLWNPDNAVFQEQMLKATETAARKLGVQLHSFGVRRSEEFDGAFAAIAALTADALLVLGDPILLHHQERIIDFAYKSRLPAIYGVKDSAAAGGLMAYASDLTVQFRRAASYVDKILKGAKPADLPVEQPTKFELVINLKTASALGLTIPPSLLARADEVIE